MVPLLSRASVYQILDAAIAANLDQVALRSVIDLDIVSKIPVASTPGGQLLVDIGALNELGINNGICWLRVWLEAAQQLALSEEHKKVFADYARRLPATDQVVSPPSVSDTPRLRRSTLAYVLAPVVLAAVVLGYLVLGSEPALSTNASSPPIATSNRAPEAVSAVATAVMTSSISPSTSAAASAASAVPSTASVVPSTVSAVPFTAAATPAPPSPTVRPHSTPPSVPSAAPTHDVSSPTLNRITVGHKTGK